MVVVGDAVVRIAPIHQCSSGCAGAVETSRVGTTQWRASSPTNKQVGLYSSNLAVAGSSVYLFAGLTEASTSAGIFRSTDSGRSWKHVASDVCGPATNPEQEPFAGATSTVADDGALIADCLGLHPGIRIAAPGSTSFSGQRRYPSANDVDLQAAESEQRIVAADTSHAYTGSNIETTFYVTTDGARTWQRTATIPVRGDSLRFRSGANGYAIAQDGIEFYATDDGGATWHSTEFSS
jgi:hypothetical protein